MGDDQPLELSHEEQLTFHFKMRNGSGSPYTKIQGEENGIRVIAFRIIMVGASTSHFTNQTGQFLTFTSESGTSPRESNEKR